MDDVTLTDLLGSLAADLHDLVSHIGQAPAGMAEVDVVEMEASAMTGEVRDEFGFAVAQLVRGAITAAKEMLDK